MTGLYNRRHFEEILAKEYQRAKRYEHPLTLVLIDADFFKRINDVYGHPAGDSVLKHISTLAQESFRTGDTLFRIGGEEFAAILPNTGGDLGWLAAERYRRCVEERAYQFEDQTISLTVSLGIATLSRSDEVMDFMKKADAALYRAKLKGRNCTEAAIN